MKTDLTYLKSMSGGSFEVIKEMIEIFIEQVNEISQEMKQALNEKNYLTLSKLAHKAKSSVSIMGMESLAADLKTFEILSHEGKEPERYQGFVTSFINDCNEAVEELKNFINEKK
jgi:HPt (histidine-containing phosphotransfer) domain-containing protein